MNKLLVIAALLVPAAATAQPLTVTHDKQEKDDSINVSPLGLLFGNLAVTYERLFDGGHGLVAEVGYGFSNGDASSERHGGVGVGYRWHWRGRQDSGFLGVMLHQQVGHGEITTDEMTYDASVRLTSLTGNIGKRWMLGDAWNVTLRLGAGWGRYTVDIDEASAEAQQAEDELNDILTLFPVAIDGELSVGYAF